MSEPGPVKPEDMRSALRKMGARVDDPTAQEQEQLEGDPIGEAFDIESYDDEDVVKVPIDGELAEELRPPDRERIRRTAGPPYDEGEEPDPSRSLWHRNVPGIGAVTVTEEEKDIYAKALLFDTRVEFTLPLVRGESTMLVTVRSLYEGENDLIALAVASGVTSHPLRGQLEQARLAALLYLRLSAALQITRVRDKVFTPFEVTGEELAAPPDIDAPVLQRMLDDAAVRFNTTHKPTYQLLMSALHIFNTKLKILEDAGWNGDFSVPAATN